jgi:ArsR family transcriptional regulator, virulence genes transcriptional regulator
MLLYVKVKSMARQTLAKPAMDFATMETKAVEAAITLSAMANPVRLLVLCALVEGEKAVNDLVAFSGISQSAVSQHLAKMRNLKLVATRRDGQTIYYRLASPDVMRLLTVLNEIYCKP